jgi:hypothetical protein
MGFMTTVGILNDRLDEIERNPEQFVTDISKAISRGKSTYHAVGQTTVMRSHHADTAEVIYAGKNCWISFGINAHDLTKEEIEVHLMFAKRAQRILSSDKNHLTKHLQQRLRAEGKTEEEIKKAIRKIK